VIDERYLGVQFRSMPRVVAPGESATVTIDVIYYPQVSYEQVKPGVEFTLREGGAVMERRPTRRCKPMSGALRSGLIASNVRAARG